MRPAFPEPPTALPSWDVYVIEFIEACIQAQRGLAVWAGRHEFDGRLPDWSPAGIERDIRRLHAQRERAAAFAAQDLDARQRFERDILIAQIELSGRSIRRR